VLLPLLAACGGSAGHAPGSVPLDGECQYDRDCQPDPAGYVFCGCRGSGKTVCMAAYPVPIVCPDEPCADGQSCSTDPAYGDGMCVPSPGEGMSCMYAWCLPGLFCNDSNVCEKAHAVGEPCNDNFQDQCAAPAWCDPATEKCTAPLAVGKPCDNRYDLTPCVAGATCSYNTSKCEAPEPNGAACDDDAGCLSHHCDLGSGSCEDLAPTCEGS
jgi:hypothetical protein